MLTAASVNREDESFVLINCTVASLNYSKFLLQPSASDCEHFPLAITFLILTIILIVKVLVKQESMCRHKSKRKPCSTAGFSETIFANVSSAPLHSYHLYKSIFDS